MDRGLFDLESDEELMLMCALINNKERPKTNRDTVICPSALKKLNKAIQYAGNCVVAWGHNARTCEVKKDDAIKKAVEEGTVPIIAKSTCVCKICNQPGHNSRTCKVKKQQQQGGNSSTNNVPREQDQQS
ncbi:hypothetical protein POM88_049853 [Heracleum sosnowskyi]|uniref:CCHC-type domain-containing protein n=1 Tax=Heracleum sosnowskyi TaxID=360622 RepID=A0AAD8M1Y6_9APIA|nr:hypothetical protein POM88_049853 [Heracleum sosnowskyi]